MTRWLSDDQTGNRSCPPNVRRCAEPPAARSYTQMLVSRASLRPKAMRRPSGDMRGSEYGPAGTGSGSGLPARSNSARVKSSDPPALTGPGRYTNVPESDTAYQALNPAVPRKTPSTTGTALPTACRDGSNVRA